MLRWNSTWSWAVGALMLAVVLSVSPTIAQEKPKAEQPKEEPKQEPAKEEPKAEPKQEQPKPEPKQEEPKPEPKKEEPKKEEPKEEPKPKDLVETAKEAGQFKTLATALQKAGLVKTLQGKGPFTVFAPADDAFKKVKTLDELLKPENNERLVEVLKYHVVSGSLDAKKLADMKEVTTLQGDKLPVSKQGDKLMIGDATVAKANVKASNGVIHVIDSVLMPEEKPVDLVATAEEAGNFSTLLKAAQTAGLVETLKGKGPFTVLAPTDAAFKKIPQKDLQALLKDKEKLAEILKYHVLKGKVPAGEVAKQKELTTLQGEKVAVSKQGNKVMIGEATVTAADIEASNGLIHVLDTVLMPPKKPVDIVATAEEAGNFSTLLKAAQAAGLVETLKGKGPFTVLAPTDEAFKKVPKATMDELLKPENKERLVEVLKYHVIEGKKTAEQVSKAKELKTLLGETLPVKTEGKKVTIGDATVATADIEASNGIIHAIDTVLIPPKKPVDIVATAEEAGNFGTLLQAAQAAGLVETLKGKGPFTVLAPTDAAFKKIPQKDLQALLKDKEQLAEILKYHVISGKSASDAVAKAKALKTLQGQSVPVKKDGDKLKLGDATVVAADVEASNGVIHAIDTVLMPPPVDIVATAKEAGNFSTLLKAATQAGLADTLAKQGPFTVLAPTDEAFKQVPKETMDELLKPENKERLVEVLKYHVIEGKKTAEQVSKAKELKTLLGETLPVKTEGKKVTIGDATVATADIEASNGIIHAIDTVLIPPKKPVDIVATAEEAGNFGTLLQAAQAAGLVETLKGKGPFTVLAPTDAAFKKIPQKDLQALLKDKEQLAEILKYHVISGKSASDAVAKAKELKTLQGQSIPVKKDGDKLKLGDATVVAADVEASNGVIHAIDTVLMPPPVDIVATAKEAGNFGTLLKAAKQAGLANTLAEGGPFTVLAPTDAAFKKVPKEVLDDLLKPENKEKLVEILKYHVIEGKQASSAVAKADTLKTLQGQTIPVKKDGDKLMVGKAAVVRADVEASNGMIHAIDTVLMPPPVNLVATAEKAGGFGTLLDAANKAGLVETLKGKGPYTLLAPTDTAFKKVPKETWDELMKPENKERLVEVLKYHLIEGKKTSEEVAKAKELKTLLGETLSVKTKDGKVMIGAATVVEADVNASNGIIHAIDAVLIPPKKPVDLVTTAEEAGKFSTLLNAAQAAGLVDALKSEEALTVFAPTDEAFKKLPEEKLNELLKPENKDQLAAILKYHIVPGKVTAAKAKEQKKLTTLQGEQLNLKIDRDKVLVGEATILQTDIEATNGMIHVIDSVLMPPKPKATVAEVKQAIERAVANGAPLYNEGKPKDCFELYQKTLQNILDEKADAVPDAQQAVLKEALKEQEASEDPRKKAWILRRAMDKVYFELPAEEEK